MTHSHALDALIATDVLERADFGYLGIIGSRTKHKRFRASLRQQGIAEREISRITCPIGGRAVRDKRPAVIAGAGGRRTHYRVCCRHRDGPSPDRPTGGVRPRPATNFSQAAARRTARASQ